MEGGKMPDRVESSMSRTGGFLLAVTPAPDTLGS